MSTSKPAAAASQPAQKKARHMTDAMFAASMRSRKKTLKIILLEVLKANPEVKKDLAHRSKKAIIERALVQFHSATNIIGDKRKEIYEMMLEDAKNFVLCSAAAASDLNLEKITYDLDPPTGDKMEIDLTDETENERSGTASKKDDNANNEEAVEQQQTQSEKNNSPSDTTADGSPPTNTNNQRKTNNPTNPPSILRRKNAPSNSPMFLSHIDIRATMVGLNEQERTTELREIIDDTLDTIRANDTTTFLVPKNNADGKAIKQISAKSLGKNKNSRGVSFRQSNALPNIKVYANDWVTKPSKWDTATIQISIKTSKPIDKVYYESAIPLLNRGIEIFPRRRNLRKIDNLPIGGILSSFNSLDHRALSFALLAKYNTYMSFETVKIVDGAFVSCGVKDTECNGFLIVVSDDDVTKGLDIMKSEWPAFQKKDHYLLGINLHAYPFDHTGKFHKHVMSKFPNIPLCMLADYQHSMVKTSDGGGSIRSKLIASVDSLTAPMIDLDQKRWTLREFIISQVDPVSGRPYIASVCPIPTQGNKKSVFTLFTTYRSGNKERTRQIAERATKFVDEKLAIEIWRKFGMVETEKVLAPAICQRIALRSSVDLTDIPALSTLFSEAPENDSDNEAPDEEDNATLASAYDNVTIGAASTIMSDITGYSARTTGSTKERLNATMVENEELSIANEDMKERQKQMEEELAALRLALRQPAAPPHVSDATRESGPENNEQQTEKDNTDTTNENLYEQNIDIEPEDPEQINELPMARCSTPDGGGSRKADSAMADPLVTFTPERISQSEPAESGMAEMPLDPVIVTPRYPLRGQVQTCGADEGAAGRG